MSAQDSHTNGIASWIIPLGMILVKARRGRRIRRSTRPAGLKHHSARRRKGRPARDSDLDFARWHAPEGIQLDGLRILA